MKASVKIISSWIVIISLIYAGLEVTALYWMPKIFPLNSLGSYLDHDIFFLAQYSKKNVLPENYIAILGDSYAFGQGDWLFNVQSNIAPEYNTTHLLFHKLGRDVVTFGIPASSSIKGYLEDPFSQLAFIRSLHRYPVSDPSLAILYFYEGNDVMDNWQEFLVRYKKGGFDPMRLSDNQNFTQFIDEGIIAKNKTFIRAKNSSTTDNLFFGRFAVALIESKSEKMLQDFKEKLNPKVHHPVFKPQPRENNTVLIANKEYKMEDMLQVPPIALNNNEIAISMNILALSIQELKRRWPNTKFGMVYIPSVGTNYNIISSTINIYDTERGKNYPTIAVLPSSDATCQQVQKIATDNHVSFQDARPALRATAQQQFIHGPVDWLHFNEAGYRVLSSEIEKLITAVDSSSSSHCAQLTPSRNL